MRFLKVQTAIMAIMLVTIPFLGIQDAKAFTKWKITYGYGISLERQEVVAKGDKVLLVAKFFDTQNADSYVWNWDICGKKSTTTTTTWYVNKNFTFKNTGSCVVKVDGQAIYDGEMIGNEPGDGVIIPGTVSDTVNVLPSETVNISITGPASAKVGQTFWLESAYNGPAGYNNVRWNWKASDACKGSSESGQLTTKIGETGDKKGKCTMTLNLRVEYPNKVVKGTAVKSITIN